MTHFTVLAALPPAEPGVVPFGTEFRVRLDAALAPYDENREVVPYLRPDGGRTTYNPRSRWDWWVVGGRWRGHFLAAPGAAERDLLRGEPGALDDGAELDAGAPRPDGGLLRALDLERMRDEAVDRAVRAWNGYAMVVHGTPEPLPFAHFWARHEAAVAEMPTTRPAAYYAARNEVNARYGVPEEVDLDSLPPERMYGPGGEGDGPYWTERAEAEERLRREGGMLTAVTSRWRAWRDEVSRAGERAGEAWDAALAYSSDDARRDYAAQPRVAAVRAHPDYAGPEWLLDDPVEEFDRWTRDEYAARARAGAVPGFALLDAVHPLPSGEAAWLAPGKMSWFACDDSTDASVDDYRAAANELLDALDPCARLVLLDCHV